MDSNPDKQTVMEVSAAASLMGVSVETLRKRLQRGRVNGFKAADGSWRVVLDNEIVRRSMGEETAGQATDQRQVLAALDAIAGTLHRLDDRMNEFEAQMSELGQQSDRLERRMEKLPALIALLELQADDPSLQDQLKPLMLAIYEVVKAVRQR